MQLNQLMAPPWIKGIELVITGVGNHQHALATWGCRPHGREQGRPFRRRQIAG